MGIDVVALNGLLLANQYTKKGRVLTLGRQGIHINKYQVDTVSQLYNVNLDYAWPSYIEPLLQQLGYSEVDSIDYSPYENATIIHDMNKPLNQSVKYDFIFDGGTIEHIFNIPQVLDTIITLLDTNGIFASVTCNNNFSGHGFYQFSPELFLSCFSAKYGMEVLDIYLAKNNTSFQTWINVKDSFNASGRNTAKFNTTDETYIVTIARKIHDPQFSLLTYPPQQNSYENIEWKQ